MLGGAAAHATLLLHLHSDIPLFPWTHWFRSSCLPSCQFSLLHDCVCYYNTLLNFISALLPYSPAVESFFGPLPYFLFYYQIYNFITVLFSCFHFTFLFFLIIPCKDGITCKSHFGSPFYSSPSLFHPFFLPVFFFIRCSFIEIFSLVAPLQAEHCTASLLVSPVMSQGWQLPTLQTIGCSVVGISFMVPESSLVRDWCHICWAMLTVSSKVILHGAQCSFASFCLLVTPWGLWWSGRGQHLIWTCLPWVASVSVIRPFPQPLPWQSHH